jgi:hypothetical protein
MKQCTETKHYLLIHGLCTLCKDPRRPDFGGIVPILRAVFRVQPGYMAVPHFETFGLHYQTEAKFFLHLLL